MTMQREATQPEASQPEASVQWQLLGSSAEAYERFLVPRLFTPWAKHMVRRAALQPGERVLDVGCGTGLMARTAARPVGTQGTVVGLDVNQTMLDVAQTTANGLQPAIEWRQGNAHQLPFADGSFDAVFCQQAIQFFEQPQRALQEMRRVLAPEGRALMSVWRPIEHNPVYAILTAALERHVGAQAAAIMHSPFPAWPAAHLRELVHAAGFGRVHLTVGIGRARFPSVRELLEQKAQSTPLAGPLSRISNAIFEALQDDLQAALAPYLDDEGVISPMQTYLITARS